MTQLQEVGRRTTVVTSATVATIVSVAITVSALLVVPELISAPAGEPDVGMRDARLTRAVESGQAWQRQRLIESASYYDRMHAAEQAGLQWQVRYEQTHRIR